MKSFSRFPVVFLLLISFLFMPFLIQGQTKFKQRVKVKWNGYPKIEKGSSVESVKDSLQIFEVKIIEVKDSLKINKKAELKSTKAKTINGVKYEAVTSKAVLPGEHIIGKKKKAIGSKIDLEVDDYYANISVSKDSLLFNFWLKHNYYNLHDSVRKGSPNPDKKYYTTLKNRQYLTFNFANWEIGALTVPFKYHFGFKENNMRVDPDFTTNINISTFFGRRVGKVRYTYDKYSGMKESRFSATFGGFVGLGSQKIDSTTTSIAKIPLDRELNVPVLSYGIGTVLNLNDFNLGVFLGIDKGLGSNARKWNHSGKMWLGFGLGYKIAIISKGED